MAKYQMVVSGRFVDAVRGPFNGWVAINEGRIRDIVYNGVRPPTTYADELVLFGEECLIMPGFIDPHVHCREPGNPHKEDWNTLGLAAAHGGVTTVATMPNYGKGNSINSRESLQNVKGLAEKCIVDVRFRVGLCPENLDSLGEMADPLVVGYKLFTTAFDPELTFKREPDAEFWDMMEYVFERTAATGRTTALHLEDALLFNEDARKSGKASAYSDWRPEKSEYVPARRALDMARRRGAIVHVCHVSSPMTLDVVREYGVSCEATFHHTEFCTDHMAGDPRLVMNPPLRRGVSAKYIRNMLNVGVVPMIGTDHAPHTLEEKESDKSPAGVPALDAYGSLLRQRIAGGEMTAMTAAAASSRNPARLLGLDDRGDFGIGKRADFAVLRMDGEGRPMPTYSKCGWTPYKTRDYVEATIKEGRLLFRGGEPVV